MIKARSPYRKHEILLSGPDGNAFALMGTARRLAKELGLDGRAIMAEMQTGDYEHLLQVFDQHFGEVVDLVRE